MNKKPNVLFLIQLPPPVHGVSVVNKNLIESTVVNSEFNLIILPLVFVKKIKDLGKPTIIKIWYLIVTLFNLIKIFVSKRIDLVYFTISPTGFAFYRDMIFVFFLKLFRKKIVFHLHGKGIKESAEKSKIKSFFYKWTFKNAKVITLSHLLNYDIKSVYKPNPYVLNNGIKSLDIKKQGDSLVTTFIFLSNLNKFKGIKIFLEAIKITYQQRYNFKVKIIGNSSKNFSIEDLNKYVRDNNLKNVVEVLGPQYGINKFNQLALSDVFVFPTLNDCFPLSIIEAMQMKLPVISTYTGAIPEIIEHGINGQIVKHNSAEEVSEAMIKYIKDTSLIKEHGLNNYHKFNQKYTQEKFEENFVKVINQIFNDFNY